MRKIILCCFILLYISFVSAWAVSGSEEEMPWDSPLEKIQKALTGRTVMIIGIILIAGAGIMLASSDGGQSKQKIFFIVMGIGIAMNAPRVLSLLFNSGAGLLLP